MSVLADCDNEVEIQRRLQRDGIAGLKHILRERRELAKVGASMTLTTFRLIDGRWLLDSSGNLLRSDPTASYVFIEKLKLEERWAGRHGGIPSADDRCVLCGKGWMLEDMHDSRPGVDEWQHISCAAPNLVLKTAGHFDGLFAKAVVAYKSRRAIRNGYGYGSGDWRGPWFIYETETCGPVRIGWRKRVMEIAWTPVRSGVPAFADVEDTHGEGYIHAYTDEQAVAYLRRIRDER